MADEGKKKRINLTENEELPRALVAGGDSSGTEGQTKCRKPADLKIFEPEKEDQARGRREAA